MNNGDRYALFTAAMEADLSNAADFGPFYKRVAALYAYGRFRKKLPCVDKDRSRVIRKETLGKFVAANNDAWYRSSLMSLTDVEIHEARCFIERALWNYTTDVSGAIQTSLDMNVLLCMWRFGPGSSKGLGRDTHAYDKLHTTKKWTVTERALPLALRMCRFDPYLFYTMRNRNWETRIVAGSTMTTVPKNEKVERTICTEPTLNMMLQLAAGSYVEGALRLLGIDISTQQDMAATKNSNQHLAGRGSFHGLSSTIDLSMASDLLSIDLVAQLWPREWFDLLMTIRSPCTEVEGYGEVELSMIGTMGNGFTFPVMTLTLLALVMAASSRRSFSNSHIAVFGDDIIVPSCDYIATCDILNRAGLMVNTSKSFSWDTPFRESCGCDCFGGVDITPPYISSLSCNADLYVAVNQLLDYSARTDVCCETTLGLLAAWIREEGKEPLVVPEWEQSYSGVRLPVVRRRYARLVPCVPQTVKRVVWENPACRLSILAGWVRSNGDGRLVFGRRRKNIPYEVETRVPLPQGFGAGRCVLTYTDRESESRLLLWETVNNT